MSCIAAYVIVVKCLVFQIVHTKKRFRKSPFFIGVFYLSSVDDRRIKKYAFSNENALLWTGPLWCGQQRRSFPKH